MGMDRLLLRVIDDDHCYLYFCAGPLDTLVDRAAGMNRRPLVMIRSDGVHDVRVFI